MKKSKKRSFYDNIDRLLRNHMRNFVKRRMRDGDNKKLIGVFSNRIRDGMVAILSAELTRVVREVVRDYEAGKRGSDGK